MNGIKGKESVFAGTAAMLERLYASMTFSYVGDALGKWPRA